MSKFQSRMVSFAHSFVWDEGRTGLYIMIFFIVFFVLITAASLMTTHIEKTDRFYLFLLLSPILILLLTIAVCELICLWGVKKFRKIFKFKFRLHRRGPSKDEEVKVIRMLNSWAENLRKLSGKSVEFDVHYQAFWQAWWAARAFGFPVFRSWKTHADFRI